MSELTTTTTLPASTAFLMSGASECSSKLMIRIASTSLREVTSCSMPIWPAWSEPA